MAQFFQVLNQEEKGSEEIGQFYPNLEENQTVQYVISADGAQHQFQGQPVVVSSEQLVVVEGQGQQVIIDQSQVTYPPSSYIIQDSNIEFTNNQQVYYMANSNTTNQIVVDQPQQVVLNHQLLQNPPIQKPLNQVLQMRNQRKGSPSAQTVQGIRGLQMSQKAQSTTEPPPLFPMKGRDSNVRKHDANDLVTLEDGTVVNYLQFSKLLAQQKQQELCGGSPIVTTSTQRKPRPPAANKRPAKPRVGPKTFSRNNSAEEQQQQQQYVASMKQQFAIRTKQNHRPPINRNQYIIQPPRPRHPKMPISRPLPEYLHSSQIQSIIDNTPSSEEYSDSIRMLVLLENGEQRLITFTLPKEACTIQEILEQVNVPFTPDTPIQVNEAYSNGLNYIVAVGCVPGFNTNDFQHETSPPPQGMPSKVDAPEVSRPAASPSPEKMEPPKFIEGKLAVCSNCAYIAEDFNTCMRCKRKHPENVKSVPAGVNNGKKIPLIEKRIGLKTNGIPRMNLLQKKRPPKPKILECETVVVSSDEEDSGDTKSPIKNVSEQLLEKLGASVTLSPISKEPSLLEIQKFNPVLAGRHMERVPSDKLVGTRIACRTVRIGSYRFVPPEPVRLDSNCFILKAPHPITNLETLITIETNQIVKVLTNYQKSLPVLFFYLTPEAGAAIRALFDMGPGSDYYFDPLSEIEESHRRITLLPDLITEECRCVIQRIYQKSQNMTDEITYKEANDILIKTCPKELTKSVLSSFSSEVKQILTYPPEGRGRLSINTEDYLCLGQDQFLNDVIIDFYLKYLLLNLPMEQQDKVHIFSTFFYKRLTTKPTKASRKSQPAESDPNLSPAQKRHARVKTWTKSVNVFEKDFIIVPINENCHWFLAIICFPNMAGSHTFDGQPIRIEPKQRKKNVLNIGSVTVTRSPEKEKKPETKQAVFDEAEMSDKDEAEGDDSELDSDDSDETPNTLSVENNKHRPPIQQPCILIFDSLAGASRSRVVATLRDYLTCEHKAKLNIDKTFTKDVIKGACPKVPQQTNFTDCGLYLLQYVEAFFNTPIKDYYIPIGHLKTWFEEIVVTKKREDISILIKTLMQENGKDLTLLPEVYFPTLNGELVERIEKEDNFMDPDEGDEMVEDEDDEDYTAPKQSTPNKTKSPSATETSEKMETATEPDIKPSRESLNNHEFDDQAVNVVTLLKPDLSETPKQSNKDTLSYLKAKRIVRHKNNSDEGPDSKKVKSNEEPQSPA